RECVWRPSRCAALLWAVGKPFKQRTSSSVGRHAAQPRLLRRTGGDVLFKISHLDHHAPHEISYGAIAQPRFCYSYDCAYIDPCSGIQSMRTARRYLAREIYRSSFVVLLALIGLFSFFALIEELDNVGSKFTLLNLFYLQALQLPPRLYDLLPIGLLIGAILALASLAQRNELVILRVSGVSGMKLLGMLWIITIPWVLAAFFLSEVVTPAAEVKVSEANLLLLGHAGGGRLSSGYWFKEEGPEGGTRIINIERLQPNGGVAGINLYEFNKSQEL